MNIPTISGKSLRESYEQQKLRECMGNFNKFYREHVYDDAEVICREQLKKDG